MLRKDRTTSFLIGLASTMTNPQNFSNNKPVEGVISGDFNVNVMQIVEAAKRSAASGKPVNLPLK